MLSWFRRKSPDIAPTFNERVKSFWQWFEEVAPRFYATIEAGKCADLTGEVIAKVDECIPGFAWVFGPGPERKGHSFTLSGEGNLHRQLLTQQWCEMAPKIEGWTFHPSRQAGPITGHVITMAKKRFDPREIWVTPSVDAEAKKIHLTIWHPAWAELDRKAAMTVVFLFLDEALGEYGTAWWIGKVDLSQDRLAESFTLDELAEFVADTLKRNGWTKLPPGEGVSLFRVNATGRTFPRSDIRTQQTCVPPLFRAFVEAIGDLPDPLAGTGADYIYISAGVDHFLEGRQVEMRGEIEDSLDTALKAAATGRCIGGAFGTERGYVDLLIFDGDRSLAIVQETLRAFRLPRGSMIEFFAREKRAQRIAL